MSKYCSFNVFKIIAEKTKSGKRISKFSQLCNGPSKLCIAMDIMKNNCNKLDVTDYHNKILWIEDDPTFDVEQMKIIACPRIGIHYGEEWISKPLRYYILHNEYVSKRNKEAENELETDN